MALTGNSIEQCIWNYLVANGLTEAGAAALMGNLKAESNLSSTALEKAHWKRLGYNDSTYTAAVDSGKYTGFSTDSAGYGLAQWTWGSRKKALLAYAKAKGRSIGDLEMQLEFLLKELRESYTVVYNILTSASSILMASNAVLTKFENPAKQGSSVQNLRASYGQAIYDRNAGKQIVNTDVKTYSYGTSKMLTAHFNTVEFRCKCGKNHSTQISTNLATRLEELFDKLHCSKIIVTSGYRCPEQDKAVGGNGGGQHTKGTAADVKCYDQSGAVISSKIVSCVAQDLGFTGIANITAAYQAIHLDVRSGSKWYGNEVKGNSTVTSDFYKYYGLSKADVAKYTGDAVEPVTAEPAKAPEAAQRFASGKAGTYVVTASSLNLRAGAGTGKRIITTIPQGAVVRCYGYYTPVSGVIWLYVQTNVRGTTYTGYVTSEWVSKK